MNTLTQKETFILKDLVSQEKLCIKKYESYEKEACDNELKKIFKLLEEEERKHYNALEALLNGNDFSMERGNVAKNYELNPTYTTDSSNNSSKEHDSFLATDAITMEKYVSSAYNFDLFQFGNEKIRKLLSDIESEEQWHAELLYKYKKANNMAQ